MYFCMAFHKPILNPSFFSQNGGNSPKVSPVTNYSKPYYKG